MNKKFDEYDTYLFFALMIFFLGMFAGVLSSFIVSKNALGMILILSPLFTLLSFVMMKISWKNTQKREFEWDSNPIKIHKGTEEKQDN